MAGTECIEEIVKSENLLFSTAKDRYLKYFSHAVETTNFFSTFLKSVDARQAIFARFHSYAKKHHLLALLSTVRLHKVQALMDLRQVLEAGACAAYAMAHPNPADFADIDAQGILNPSKSRFGKFDSLIMRLPA